MTVSMGSGGSYVGLSWKDSSESSIHNVINTSACTLYAPLKSSLILSKGTGDPTWSRATKAWGFNELGYLDELASGCAFFGGARLVYNTLTSATSYSENVNVAGWSKSNCTTPSADTVVCAASNTHQRITGGSITTVAGQVFYCSFRATYVDVQFIQARLNWSATPAYVNFDLLNGTYAGYDGFLAAGMTLVSPGVYDCWCRLATTYTGAGSTAIQIQFATASNSIPGSNFNGDGVKSFKITKLSVVDVTNYDASYVPEYVSVGVVSSPFFGAGIDGAKYFETDWQGAPIAAANLLGFRREAAATNNLLYCRDLRQLWGGESSGSDLVSNGTFTTDTAGWTATRGATLTAPGGVLSVAAGGSLAGAAARQTLTCVIGTKYIITVDVVLANTARVRVGTGTDVTSGVVFEYTIPTAGTYSIGFVATATSMNLFLESNAVSTTSTFDNVVVKTASVQCALTATGIDGIANTATTLTAGAADAIILQPITLASAARCASAYVKRRTGTGTISFTQDGGSTWTDITSQINSSTWSRVEITATLANPSVGFKISTSGDAIDVDCVQNEAGAVATSPIVTTTAAVTRNAESLTYQTSGNIDFAVGTLYCEAQFASSLTTRRAVAISADGHLYINTGDANTIWKAYDGTNIVTKSGLSDISTGKRKRTIAWGTGLKVTGDGLSPASGSFDGSFGSGATMEIGQFINGYIGPVAIYNYQMTDAELQAITT